MIKRILNFFKSKDIGSKNPKVNIENILNQLNDIEITLVEDIIKKVENDFKNESSNALKLLQNYENEHGTSPRVTRCIVHLSNGNLNKLMLNISMAEDDWRDIIVEAEDEDFQFNKPFK